MMRITTLCSAFILSILSLSLFAQESVDPSPLPTDSLQPAPEAIKPAKTVKSSTVVEMCIRDSLICLACVFGSSAGS